jgi:NOL1/NOP2/sun family putative RNA methylase
LAKIPEKFLAHVKRVENFDEVAFVAVHKTSKPITSIRKNTLKYFDDTTSFEKVPWCSNGFYLPERPQFTLDPFLHAGAYYVQEASCMFLEQVLLQTLDVTSPQKVLDLCTAPGGKTTLIQSVLHKHSVLVSNEVIKSRVNILCENITKWGASNVVVTNNNAQQFAKLAGFFDAIVVDAPCSGSGMFRKEFKAIDDWSIDNVNLCSKRQERILEDVLHSLKQDGVLIYSTCSYSYEENEAIINWLVQEKQMQTVQLNINPNWAIVETNNNGNFGYRFYPNQLKGEGFFIAALKKGIATNVVVAKKRRQNLYPQQVAKRRLFHSFLIVILVS